MLKGVQSDLPVNNCTQQKQQQQLLTNGNKYNSMDLIQCKEKMKQIY